ncbi:hypothetical protein Q3G72_007018 [Acer saccharum]|nr:hypothetical protein Q3G72_007018 [Acer saccharum]
MQIGQLPFSYLGVLLFRGKPRKAVLRPIANKILSKFAKWKGKSLSLAGHATLIMSVITGLFVHSFMIYKWLSSLLSLINRKLRNFLWTCSCEEIKLVRVTWYRCCRPYSQGGLGLKDLGLLNDSLLRKFTWKFMTSDSFAFTFFWERYLRHLQKPRGGYVTSSIWSSLWTNYSSFLKDLADWRELSEGLLVVWWRDVWSRFIPPSHSALTWRLMLNRLPTEDRLCRILWKAAIHAVIWGVWTARNQWIFEGKSVDFKSVLSLVWRAVSEANRLEIGFMHNCMDDLLILHRFGLQGCPSKALVIKSVVWSPPAPSWIKVNTYGAALGSLGVGGCGGIFRNCRAFVKGCFAIPLGQVFTFEAELLAASLTINFAWKYGWHRIWLESDSSYVVQLLSSRSEMVPWRVRQARQRCIFQISHMDFQVSHIFREGNQVADMLSKHALELQADSWWFSAPPFCSSLVGNDCMGRESFCFS